MQPPESVEDPRAIPSPEVLAAARELLENVELLDIRPCTLTASIEEGVGPGTHVAHVCIEMALSFAADEGIYGNRFDYRFELLGDNNDPVGRIEFSLLLDYAVAEGFKPDSEAAEFVTGSTGYFAAYPYARELFQSLAARLQFDPIVLGLIKRGSIRPGSINVTVLHTDEP